MKLLKIILTANDQIFPLVSSVLIIEYFISALTPNIKLTDYSWAQKINAIRIHFYIDDTVAVINVVHKERRNENTKKNT